MWHNGIPMHYILVTHKCGAYISDICEAKAKELISFMYICEVDMLHS